MGGVALFQVVRGQLGFRHQGFQGIAAAMGLLNFDDFGPHIGQYQGAERPRQGAA